VLLSTCLTHLQNNTCPLCLFNVRGVRNRDKLLEIAKIAKYSNADLIVLVETIGMKNSKKICQAQGETESVKLAARIKLRAQNGQTLVHRSLQAIEISLNQP
jgi:hypothetical protein